MSIKVNGQYDPCITCKVSINTYTLNEAKGLFKRKPHRVLVSARIYTTVTATITDWG